MAANIDYDTAGRIIYVTTAPTGGTLTLNVDQEIYSAAKVDWQGAALNKFRFPFAYPAGGFTITPGKKLSPYIFIRYGWRMRPYEADHTLYLTNGVLIEPSGADPWIQTIGGYTVNVRDVIPSDARTLETGVSGLTAAESAALLNIEADQSVIQGDISTIQGDISTIQIDMSSMDTTQAAMEQELLRSLGLMQENFMIDQQQYIDVQGQKLITSSRFTLYKDAAYMGSQNQSHMVARYQVNVDWTGQEQTSYRVTRINLSTTTTT